VGLRRRPRILGKRRWRLRLLVRLGRWCCRAVGGQAVDAGVAGFGGDGAAIGIGGVVQEVNVGAIGILLRFLKSVSQVLTADFHDACAQVGDSLAFYWVGIGRKKNCGGDAQGFAAQATAAP
jgi:hypothetical protein